MSQPNINTPNSDLVSSLSQSQSYLSPNFLVILPGLTSSVRLCGVERCPAQQSEEEEEEEELLSDNRLISWSRNRILGYGITMENNALYWYRPILCNCAYYSNKNEWVIFTLGLAGLNY